MDELRFRSSLNDPCLHIKITSALILIIALYVDDLFLIGNSKEEILKLKREFKKKFEMKDMGPVAVMLGIEIKRDRTKQKLFISQKKYTDSECRTASL